MASVPRGSAAAPPLPSASFAPVNRPSLFTSTRRGLAWGARWCPPFRRGTSPSASAHRSAPPLLWPGRQVGSLTREGPLISALARVRVHSTGCTQQFRQLEFKRISKMIFQIFVKCFGKCLCTHFGSKFVETNFARFLVTRST